MLPSLTHCNKKLKKLFRSMISFIERTQRSIVYILNFLHEKRWWIRMVSQLHVTCFQTSRYALNGQCKAFSLQSYTVFWRRHPIAMILIIFHSKETAVNLQKTFYIIIFQCQSSSNNYLYGWLAIFMQLLLKMLFLLKRRYLG